MQINQEDKPKETKQDVPKVNTSEESASVVPVEEVSQTPPESKPVEDPPIPAPEEVEKDVKLEECPESVQTVAVSFTYRHSARRGRQITTLHAHSFLSLPLFRGFPPPPQLAYLRLCSCEGTIM